MGASNSKKKEEEQELVMDQHTISIDELCTRLETNTTQGLTNDRARELLARDGPNQLKPHKDSRLADQQKSMYPKDAVVVREGEVKSIPHEEVVVGDIVEIKAGELIPADLRVISSDGCRVDKSGLTGDSEPQLLNPEKSDENPLETQNLAFFATKVVEGTARGIVINVGDKTTMGRLAPLMSVLE